MLQYMQGYRDADHLLSMVPGEIQFIEDALGRLWGTSVGEDNRWSWYELGYYNRVKTEFVRQGWGIEEFRRCME